MWILVLMILLMPFEKNPYLHLADSFLGIFPDFTVIKLLGLIGAAWAVFLLMGGTLSLRLWESQQVRAFTLYLTAALLSGLVSGVGLQALTRLLGILLFLPLVLVAVRTEEDFRRVATLCALVMILVFPYAVRQMIRYDSRMGVGVYEANYFALALVLLTPLTFVIARQQEGFGKRAFWFVGAGVLVASIVLTGSRGGFLGLLIGMGLLAFRMARRRLMLASLTVAALLVFVLVFPTNLGRRLLASGLSPGGEETDVTISTESHFSLMEAGLRMIAANPVFGVGLGNFRDYSESYGEVVGVAHNTYVEIGAESGLPALFAFLVVVVMIFRSLGRSARIAGEQERPHVRDWAIAMQAGLAGYLVSAFFLSAQFEKFFWLIAFLSICLERVLSSEVAAIEEEIVERPVWTR